MEILKSISNINFCENKKILESKGLVVIDYEYHRWDWWFLGKGSLSILIDGDETISLTGKETRNKVYSSGKRW